MRAVRANNLDDLERVFVTSNPGTEKVAAFFLELVLMNYGALKLQPKFVARMAELCRLHDVPMIVDEIQTGLWSPRLFMYHEYGLRPAMVGLGKGFPGGEYAASRLLFASKFDTLPQFGALVTNGQEELASLVYLIGMRWVGANADMIESVGEYYEQRVRDLASHHPAKITTIDGRRHLLGIHFASLDAARGFVRANEAAGLDISVQTYKSSVPPVALTKLPLIAGYEVVDLVIDRFEAALRA